MRPLSILFEQLFFIVFTAMEISAPQEFLEFPVVLIKPSFVRGKPDFVICEFDRNLGNISNLCQHSGKSIHRSTGYLRNIIKCNEL